MTNPNRNPNRSNEPILDNSIDDTINARPADQREIDYRNGYVKGRVLERDTQQAHQRVNAEIHRANEATNAFNGLILGIILAAGVGFAVAAFSLWYRDRNPVQIAPVPPAPTSPVPSNSTDQKTIIERTTDRVREIPVPVPVPAPSSEGNTTAPAPSQPQGTSNSPADQPSDSPSNETSESQPSESQTPPAGTNPSGQ
ncbi:hypothetical protein BST81_11130 [Leptolyngbya sp. 'hensonii']|uniref:hypothetical protein n=1 Tax=Leptolyngbya sp. 'hensonii' TaxID=1922337 RepID=UPI00094FD791|nr:hypothetical protein [Leptolyngbya sp. 'hensonii']OLP18340.1 hypothetical protein BST81_11130 [Leptolyngbya sp. 'hensonii']